MPLQQNTAEWRCFQAWGRGFEPVLTDSESVTPVVHSVHAVVQRPHSYIFGGKFVYYVHSFHSVSAHMQPNCNQKRKGDAAAVEEGFPQPERPVHFLRFLRAGAFLLLAAIFLDLVPRWGRNAGWITTEAC